MALKFTTSYIEDALAVFRQYKQLGEQGHGAGIRMSNSSLLLMTNRIR